MGLDGVELLIAVEDRFGIVIDDADAGRVRTVGDLHDLVLAKIEPRGSSGCLSGHAFYRLRRSLHEQFGVLRSRVAPQMMLADLVPKVGRSRAWRTLAESLAWRLPELRRANALENGMLVAFFVTVAAAIIGDALGLIPKVVAWAMGLGAVPGLWLCYQVTTPLAIYFPAQCETVGKTAEAIVALNFARISKERGARNEKEVWSALRDTIVERLGVKPSDVVRGARFVEDLQVD